MATVPAVAYLGDRYQYLNTLNRWGKKPFHRLATFEEGPLGAIAQKDISGLKDGFDQNAGGSTYTDEVLFEGRQVAKLYAPVGSVGAQSYGGSFVDEVRASRHQEVWSQCTMLFPSDKTDFEETAVGGGGWKLMRQTIKPSRNNNFFHADAYIGSQAVHPDEQLYFQMEAHTASNSEGTHTGHNSIIPAGDRADWEIPRDQWVDIQYYIYHDIGHYEGASTRLKMWHGDTLIANVSWGQNMHSLADDDDIIKWVELCTYINANSDNGVTKPQTWYCAAYEVTNMQPDYTDAQGNHKLPPRVQL